MVENAKIGAIDQKYQIKQKQSRWGSVLVNEMQSDLY
jgi:hypothetical protein